MSRKIHKNWGAICKEPNPLFRWLLATATDKKILAGLKIGFPCFFSETKQPAPRAPLSLLKEMMAAPRSDGGKFLPEGVLDELGIPYIQFELDDNGRFVGIPNSWGPLIGGKEGLLAAIYEGKSPEVVILDYQDQMCLLIEHEDEAMLMVTPAQFIDLFA